MLKLVLKGGVKMPASKVEMRFLRTLSALKERVYQQQFQTKESAYSRTSIQKMSFEEAALFMVANSGKSLSIELLNFFNDLPGARETISKQAFSKQRQYIKSELFEDLNSQYIKLVYQDKKELFYEMLLIAVDGSTLEIPNVESLREYYGSAKASSTSVSNARAGINGFYDPLNHMMLRLIIDKYQKNETKVFLEHLDEIIAQYSEEKLCFIFDRGYISLSLLLELERRGVKYLFRVPSHCYKKEIEGTKEKDSIINLKITKARLKGVTEEKLDAYLRLEYLTERLIKIELDSGETEYLITNIQKETVPYDKMKAFYFNRWEIERMFNVLKNRLHIENISARTPIGVEQDIQATVFLGNVIQDAINDATRKLTKNESDKYEYRVNVNMLCGTVKHYFLFFVYNDNIDDQLREYHYKRIATFIRQTVVAHKKGKKNQRIKRVSRNKYKTNMRMNY